MTTSPLTLKSALVGVALAAAATFGATGTASADSFSFGFSIGDRNGPHIVYRSGDRYSRHYNRHYRHERPRRARCTPRRAVQTARHIGVRHAQLRRYGPKGAVVSGRYRGDRVRVRLNRNCRIKRIAYR